MNFLFFCSPCPGWSGCDRRERTVRSVLNGQSCLFYHNHKFSWHLTPKIPDRSYWASERLTQELFIKRCVRYLLHRQWRCGVSDGEQTALLWPMETFAKGVPLSPKVLCISTLRAKDSGMDDDGDQDRSVGSLSTFYTVRRNEIASSEC